MSRKWERMIEKNRKTINVKRKKQGQNPLTEGSSESLETYKGRSWMFPLFLLLFGVFYYVSYWNMIPHDSVFWLTGISYFLLALLIYAVRRPVIRFGKKTLTARRFAGDRTVEAHEIEEITVGPSTFAIKLKDKRGRWLYSKHQHRFPMEPLTNRLRSFAVQNNVKLNEETK